MQRLCQPVRMRGRPQRAVCSWQRPTAALRAIAIDRFQCAENDFISVSQKHVNTSEAGLFEQTDPSGDRQAITNAIDLAGAQQCRMVVAEKRVSPRPEALPILAR